MVSIVRIRLNPIDYFFDQKRVFTIPLLATLQNYDFLIGKEITKEKCFDECTCPSCIVGGISAQINDWEIIENVSETIACYWCGDFRSTRIGNELAYLVQEIIDAEIAVLKDV